MNNNATTAMRTEVRQAIVIGGKKELFRKNFQVDWINWIVPQSAERNFFADVKSEINMPDPQP